MAAHGDDKMTALFEKFIESSTYSNAEPVNRILSIVERVS